MPALPEPAAEPGSSPTSPACTDLGIELAVALLEQCPGTSLQDVRRWALLLWLDMAGSAALQRLPRARPVPRLLVVCQQALSSGLLSVLEQAKVVHIACKVVYGSELTTAYVQSRPGRHLVQLVEAALARAEAGAVHLKAATLARELCALLMARSKGEGAQAQAASVARIDELMAKCRRAAGGAGAREAPQMGGGRIRRSDCTHPTAAVEPPLPTNASLAAPGSRPASRGCPPPRCASWRLSTASSSASWRRASACPTPTPVSGARLSRRWLRSTCTWTCCPAVWSRQACRPPRAARLWGV